jgi:hypothetical protein
VSGASASAATRRSCSTSVRVGACTVGGPESERRTRRSGQLHHMHERVRPRAGAVLHAPIAAGRWSATERGSAELNATSRQAPDKRRGEL